MNASNRKSAISKSIYGTLWIALGYVVGARLGVLLALLPEWNVTLVWPPSGVALAAVLLGGRTALPGIFLGAFIATLIQQSSPLTPLSFYIGLAVSLAPMLSAVAASRMLKHIARKAPDTVSATELLKGFIAIGLASIIAASAGISILYVFGVVSVNDAVMTWGLWWLADFCGMLIFGPIAWLAARFWKEYRNNFQPGPLVPAIMLNSAVTALAILVFMLLWNSEIKNVSKSLAQESTVAASTVTRLLRTAGADMEGIRSFLYASEHVSADEFRRYNATEFQNGNIATSAQALEWVPRATNPEKWETLMRNEGQARVQLHEIDNTGKRIPVAQRDEYFPVQYVQPSTRANLGVIGFDICSEKLRCAALQRARDTGLLSMVTIFPVQLDKRAPAILLTLPVYRPDTILDTVAARRTNLIGFATGVYLIADLFDRALPASTADIDLHLIDEGMPKASQWYHTRVASHRAHLEEVIPTPTLASLQRGLHGTASIRFADHNWLVVATPGATYVHSHRTWTPWAALVLILALGIALSSILIERVTARKNVEDERQKTDQALLNALAANESKSYFMAAASHDIKQPLYALKMLTDTLSMSDTGNQSESVLQDLRGSIDQMSEHFDNLMDFGMFHDGNFEVNPVRFRLGEFSERIDLEIAPLCSSKGLTWKMDIEDVFVWTDQDLLLRLFRNLLTNAIRYTDSGEVCCSAKASADTVEFLISDTGIGIPMDQQEDVFRKFVRVQNSGVGVAGEGLGLSIVAKIDQALNLGLQMSSVIGKGTEFRFRLPREPLK